MVGFSKFELGLLRSICERIDDDFISSRVDDLRNKQSIIDMEIVLINEIMKDFLAFINFKRTTLVLWMM